MTRTSSWTAADCAQLEELFAQGLSNMQLAVAVGRPFGTVVFQLKKLGLSRQPANCLDCGKPLAIGSSRLGGPKLFCDTTCGQRARRKYTQEELRRMSAQVAQRPESGSTCRTCGKFLTQTVLERRKSKNLPVEYCSGGCFLRR